MEINDQSPVKSSGLSTAYGEPSGSQLGIKQQLSSAVSMDVGSDATTYVSNVSFTASGNLAEHLGNARPSHRVVPADEPGTHQVTFTVTISVAFPPGETALCMCTKNMFCCYIFQ